MVVTAKNTFYTIFILLASVYLVKAQTSTNYEPKILVLTPAKTKVAASLQKELQNQNDTIKNMIAKAKLHQGQLTDQANDQPENLRLMMKNNREFMMHLDFFKQISYLTSNFLVYRFYERFPNVMLMLKDTTVDSGLNALQMLAKKENMPYIVNFPNVEFWEDHGKKSSKITVQLYEQASNSLLIDQVYTGDDGNPGFEFTCSDGTLNCTINNALSVALQDIVTQIATNNPTLKRQRELSAQRVQVLKKDAYRNPYDATLLKSVIAENDSSINMKTRYQCLYNADHTQFVAFFLETGIDNNFKTLHDKTDQGKIDIITNKDIKDPGYFDDMPKTYAYIVKGVKYKNQWYYKKDQITYFDAPTLEAGRLMYFTKLAEWNYFSENTSNYSPEFWNGPLFEKVVDRTKDPKWEKYKDMWEMEERENRNYIGLYDIVAEKLKQEKKAEAKDYQHELATTILRPFFDGKIKNNIPDFVGYEPIDDDFVLIYPQNRDIILIPLKVKNKAKEVTIRFFVYLPITKKIYEWTYLPPQQLEKKFADEPINKAIGSLTKWDFSYDTLDDNKFWQNDVLLQEAGKYKYLKAVN